MEKNYSTESQSIFHKKKLQTAIKPTGIKLCMQTEHEKPSFHFLSVAVYSYFMIWEKVKSLKFSSFIKYLRLYLFLNADIYRQIFLNRITKCYPASVNLWHTRTRRRICSKFCWSFWYSNWIGLKHLSLGTGGKNILFSGNSTSWLIDPETSFAIDFLLISSPLLLHWFLVQYEVS